MACRRLVLGLAVVTSVAVMVAAAEPVLLMDPDGNPVRWNDWLEANGPAAVVVWSSWVPGSDTVKRQLAQIRTVCGEQRLSLIVIDVQEPLAAGRAAFNRSVAWLHDRHGAILKQYRVIELPAMIVVDRDGSLIVRLAPTAGALASWRPAPEEQQP